MTAERTLRTVVVSGVLGAAVLVIGAPSAAQGAWCARYATGSANCHFTSRQQCLEAVSGIGGACSEIQLSPPAETAEPPERLRRRQPTEAERPQRKQQQSKQQQSKQQTSKQQTSKQQQSERAKRPEARTRSARTEQPQRAKPEPRPSAPAKVVSPRAAPAAAPPPKPAVAARPPTPAAAARPSAPAATATPPAAPATPPAAPATAARPAVPAARSSAPAVAPPPSAPAAAAPPPAAPSPAPAVAARPSDVPAAAPRRAAPAVAAPPRAPAVAARPSAPAGLPSGPALAAARNLVLNGQYEAGIAALRALKTDADPDVAAFLGLAHRKLGQTDAARAWYDRALTADPDHRLTLSFYGIMHAEMGARDKAVQMLRRLRTICGGESCSEFRALFLVLTGGG
jgi:hypothetical protein